MKKPLLILMIFIAGLQTAHSQQYHVDSTRFIVGAKPATSISYAIPTRDKGILFVGSEMMEPGGIIPSFPLDVTFMNVMIGKIDSNQKIAWIIVYGGTKDDYAISACQTSDGGYAVLASTQSIDGDITGNKGGSDLWLLKVDGNGNLQWQKTYGSSVGEVPASVASTSDGGFIILGATDGTDGDVPFHYGGFFTLDWLVIKTDGSGNVQWTKDIGGTGDEQSYGSILSVGDNYYIASGSSSRDNDCIDTAWNPGAKLNDDAYLIKLDNTGVILWGKSFGGSRGEVFYSAIYDERDNTLVMTGSGRSTDYMVTDQHGEGDMFTVKTDLDGNIIWHKAIGEKSEDIGKCIIKDQGTGYLLYGSIFPEPDTTFGCIAGVDNELISIDKDGNQLAYKIFGGKNAETPASLVPYLNTYVATGYSPSKAFTEGTYNINNGGAFVSYLGPWALKAGELKAATNSAIVVYPSPSHRSVTISVPGTGGRGELTITGSNGSPVWEKRTRPGDIEVNIESWPDGVYIVHWQAHDGTPLTAKFVKS